MRQAFLSEIEVGHPLPDAPRRSLRAVFPHRASQRDARSVEHLIDPIDQIPTANASRELDTDIESIRLPQ